MWNSLSDIKLYEDLLAKRLADGHLLTEKDVNFQKICRTCLRDAPDTNNLLKDFEIGAMNFNFDGKILKLIDMLAESTNLEVSGKTTVQACVYDLFLLIFGVSGCKHNTDNLKN